MMQGTICGMIYFFKHCADSIARKCLPLEETRFILHHCHSLPCGGHHGLERTMTKVLQYGFFWPTLFNDDQDFMKACDQCHRTGSIGKKQKMPLKGIPKVELFNVCDLDFIGPFLKSFGKEYILVGVEYVSKWVEEITLLDNTAKLVVKFVKPYIFWKFQVPRDIISDIEIHFNNHQSWELLVKHKSTHGLATTYQSQTSGEVKAMNKELQRILEKTPNTC